MSHPDNNTPEQGPRPLRIGVFTELAKAEHAFQSLLDAGFVHEELSVICSNEQQQNHFPDDVAEGEDPDSVKVAATGGVIGGVLGGVGAAAGLATIAGIPVVVAGAMAAALAGGVVGGLTGVMSERGFEGEASDYFDQAVTDGKILVAAEPAENDPKRLDLAANLLRDAGAEPISLLDG